MCINCSNAAIRKAFLFLSSSSSCFSQENVIQFFVNLNTETFCDSVYCIFFFVFLRVISVLTQHT